jgi:hypothetical protein
MRRPMSGSTDHRRGTLLCLRTVSEGGQRDGQKVLFSDRLNFEGAYEASTVPSALHAARRVMAEPRGTVVRVAHEALGRCVHQQ